jgi:hypothetical protein
MWFRNSDARIREQSGNIKSSLPILTIPVCSFAFPQVLAFPNQGALAQQQPEFSEVRNCVSGFLRELVVLPSKLVLLFNAAFCRREKSLTYCREKGWLVGAVGIEIASH